jgi:hypothetical protein
LVKMSRTSIDAFMRHSARIVAGVALSRSN